MGRITAIARLPTPATCLTALATPHLTAPTAAATHLTAPTATPHRTVITDRPATTGGLSGFSTEGARRVDSSAPQRAGDNPPARRINRRAGAFKDKREMKLPWMNPRLRELLALAAVAAFGCGLAWSHGDLLFVAIFGAACALTLSRRSDAFVST